MNKTTNSILEKYFDTAFDSPGGIARLRELILTLAMQGKLVTQDPTDEPASVLLERIRAEKVRLVKEGGIKKQKPLPGIKDGEVPYQLPERWEWCRLGNATSYNGRSKVSSSAISKDCWVLDLEDIEKDTSKLLRKEIFKNRLSKSTKSEFHKNDVLYGKLRPYLNKVIVADENGVCTTEIVPINTLGLIEPSYLKFFLRSPRFIRYVNDLMYGVKMPRLGTNDALITPFPLPPLKEQQRIVQRIDQLMVRCDALEALRKERQNTIVQVHQAALQGMLSANGTEVFQRNWDFLSRNFSDLYSVRENMAELRKAVLQLAVMGKLVEQDPDDEPASVLLERIRGEKKRLVAEGKIKTQKALGAVDASEVPFEVPEGWEWCRLGDVVTFTTGKLDSNASVENGKYPFFTCSKQPLAIDDYAFDCEAILLAGNNAAGKYDVKHYSGKFNAYQRTYVINTEWKNVNSLEYGFLKYYLIEKLDELQNKSLGTLTRFLTLGILHPLLLPLPPLYEQKRIVQRIDELMELCDRLEEQLDGSEKVQGELLNAVMAGVQ